AGRRPKRSSRTRIAGVPVRRRTSAQGAAVPVALDQVFKAYDVRGVYPDQLDEERAGGVGGASVPPPGAGPLAIGQDMRPSSKPMADALAAGAMAQGADVLRVGLC